LVFAGTARFDLTNWDDPVYVTESQLVRDLSPSGIARIFDPRSHVVYDWTPLVTLTYAAEVHAVGAPLPALHHTTNVLLHAATAALAVGLLRRMGLTLAVALIGGLLFAVHPLQVESVAWVSGRKTILSTLFSVLCARSYLSAETGFGRAGAATLFGAALLSKATVVGLPLWLAAADRTRGRLRANLPWLGLLGGASLARVALSVWAQEEVVEEASARGLAGRLAVMGPVLLRYIRQTLIPHDLSAHYSWTPLGWTDPQVWGSWLGVAVLAGLVVRAARRDPGLRLAAIWVGVALLPVLNLLPAPHFQADRYLYMPLVAGGALLAAPLTSLGRRTRLRPIVAGGLALLLVGLAAGSVLRCRVWRGSIPLWEDTVRRDPGFAVAHANLGAALLTEGSLREADTVLRRSIALEPRLTRARVALSLALRNRGQLEAALRESQAALRNAPHDVGALVAAAEIAELAGQTDHARALYERALREEPHAVVALERLAVLEVEQGHAARSLDRVRLARRLRPDLRGIALSEAWVLLRAGRAEEARPALAALDRAHPNWAEPTYTLALLERDAGNEDAAGRLLDESIRRDPGHARARIHRARLRLSAGDRGGAEADLQAAIDAVPFRLAAVLPLADLLIEDGREEEALALLERTAPLRTSPEVLRRIAPLLSEQDRSRAREVARQALALLGAGENPPWRAELEPLAQ
jgi:tetratricopeptide (TPR) repeat protein